MRFLASTDCFFGDGRYTDLAAAHPEFTGPGGLLLADGALKGTAGMSLLQSRLAEVNVSVDTVHYLSITREPTYDDLDALSQTVESHNPTYLLAVGGGSLMDLAKGASVLMRNPGSGRDYRGMGLVKNPMLSLLAVPTTAGTGSEVTWTASFVDDDTRIKLGINGPNVFPTAALLEPSLLEGSPRDVALSAGLDAMVHAVEAVSSPMASRMSAALAKEAVHLIMESLVAALTEQSARAWYPVQVGAYLAGLAMLNSQGGVASGISYPIGTAFGVPHGFAGGILLPWVVSFNTHHGYTGYDVFRTDDRRTLSFSTRLKEFYDELKVPGTLARWGAGTPEAAEKLFELTLTQRQASLGYNPVPFTATNVEDLLGDVCRRD